VFFFAVGGCVLYKRKKEMYKTIFLQLPPSPHPKKANPSPSVLGSPPPQKKSKVASLSDCKGASSSPQSLIRLIQLQPFLFKPRFFDFIQRKLIGEVLL